MKGKIIAIFVTTLLITTIIPNVSSLNINKMLSPGVPDQEQTDTSETHFLENGKLHWQKFVNRGNIIEAVDVHIGCYYSGSEDITLLIRENLDLPILTKKTHQATDLPDNYQDWFTFDVEPDIRLNPNQGYLIVIEFGPGSEYEWSGAHGNLYPLGTSSHPDGDWDYAFRTIVDKRPKSKTSITPFLDFLENLVNMFPLLQKLMLNLGL